MPRHAPEEAAGVGVSCAVAESPLLVDVPPVGPFRPYPASGHYTSPDTVLTVQAQLFTVLQVCAWADAADGSGSDSFPRDAPGLDREEEVLRLRELAARLQPVLSRPVPAASDLASALSTASSAHSSILALSRASSPMVAQQHWLRHNRNSADSSAPKARRTSAFPVVDVAVDTVNEPAGLQHDTARLPAPVSECSPVAPQSVQLTDDRVWRSTGLTKGGHNSV
jgi:hypothetical protein